MDRISCARTIEKPKRILSMSGVWPTAETTRYTVLNLLFNFGFDVIVLTVIILNMLNALKFKKMNLLNKMICLLISMINYTAKASTLTINKKCFLSIIEDLESAIFNGHSKQLNNQIESIYNNCDLVFRYFAIMLVTYSLIGSILPMIVDVGITIPAPFDTGKYEILYEILHFFATGLLSCNTIGLDILCLTLISICVAQTNILQERLMYVLEDCQETCVNKYFLNLEIDQTLRECIILHEKIIGFVKKLNTLLSFPLFIQYTCGCFILCNTVVQLTILREAGSSNTASMVGYAAITFGQMAMYHWFGNEIIFTSDNIIKSAYLSKWYKLTVSSQRTIFLLMERAKQPLSIQVYKFIFISLDSMGVIVRWAYSVFALIKARYG